LVTAVGTSVGSTLVTAVGTSVGSTLVTAVGTSVFSETLIEHPVRKTKRTATIIKFPKDFKKFFPLASQLRIVR